MSQAAVIIAEIEQISASAVKTFGPLSEKQINWKPNAEGWSVGQCFEHLIKTNELFYQEMDKIANGTRQNSFWENWSPLTGLGGSFLIKSLKSDKKKFKAPTPKIVPPSDIEANIIEQFAQHLTKVKEKVKKTENADWQRIVVTSPFMSLMTYRLDDGYRVIVEHCKRHFRQAERVVKTEGFPE